MGWYHFLIAEEMQREKDKENAMQEKGETQPGGETHPGVAQVVGETPCPLPADADPDGLSVPDVPIYHLAQRRRWFDAVKDTRAYFPPSFIQDGRFTRASVDLADMPTVANEFYKDSVGDWICLELDPKAFLELGIQIEAHMAPESTPDAPVKCLKVFGGISTKHTELVTAIYEMTRAEDGTFLGLTKLDCGCAVRKEVESSTAAKIQAAKAATRHLSEASAATSQPQRHSNTARVQAAIATSKKLSESKAKTSAGKTESKEAPKPAKKGLFGRIKK